jgi:hypothetical protein
MELPHYIWITNEILKQPRNYNPIQAGHAIPCGNSMLILLKIVYYGWHLKVVCFEMGWHLQAPAWRWWLLSLRPPPSSEDSA